MAKKEQKKEQKKEKSLAETKKVEPVSYQTKKTRKKGKKINKKKLILRILLVLFILALISIGVLAGVVIGILNKYTLTKADLMIAYENSIMLDSEGNVIAELNGDENRANVTYEQMSKYLPVAFVSIEDQRFEEHDGVDLKRTLAAALTYVFTGDSSFGGSTITQQLVKNITKDDDRDATRKIKEMARAYSVEKIMTKGDILEMYLNLVFLGETAHGVEIASKLYFNKHALDLTLAESAFLAGINHSPNAYKPFIDDADMKKKIADRTKQVIDKMKELGKITEEEYTAAMAEVDAGLVFTRGVIAETNFSYHTDAAYNAVVEEFMAKNNWTKSKAENYVRSAGLKIYTTQNTAIQRTMEEVYANSHVIKSTKTKIKDAEGNDTEEYATSQSAMVLIDNETGYVVATVGGLGEKVAFGFNRGTSARHNPGSSIKPLAVIAPSVEKGLITAATVVDDVETAFNGGGYTPHNYSGDYQGLMNVRKIIEKSQNIPEVKMIQNLGPENSVEFMRNMGISTLITAAEAEEQQLGANDENLAIALGGLTNGVTPLDMAGAYATIANDGVYRTPLFFSKVEDADGNVILEATQETRTVMSADSAYIVKSILTQPVISGTATGASISRMDVAAKTGTTDKNEDKWLCGFTEYYTGAAWYGFDYQESFNGTNYALINWANVMRPLHANLESRRFTKTANIVSASVCRDSGLLATELCRNDQRGSRVYTEVFVKGTVPNKSCTCHVLAKVVGTAPGNYKLATPHCPDAKELVFITRPNSATNRSWTKAEDAMYMLPEQTCELHIEAPASSSPSPSPSGSPSTSPSISPKPSGKPGESASPTVKPSTSPSAKPPETPVTTKPTTTPSATAQPSQNPTSTPSANAAPTTTNT